MPVGGNIALKFDYHPEEGEVVSTQESLMYVEVFILIKMVPLVRRY